MRVLIIIPAYNEEENIKDVVDNLINNYPQYDYIVINDGSSDDTEIVLKNNRYNYITLPCNLGIGSCVQTGYQYSVENNYDISIQIDGDGQHKPEYINDLVKEIIETNSNMVTGSRFLEKEGFQSTGLRRMGIKFMERLIYILTNEKLTDTTSGFRATDKNLTHFYSNNYAKDYPETEAIVLASLNGYKIKEIPVLMQERQGGKSSISGFKSIYFMIKVTLALILAKISYKKKRVKNG